MWTEKISACENFVVFVFTVIAMSLSQLPRYVISTHRHSRREDHDNYLDNKVPNTKHISPHVDKPRGNVSNNVDAFLSSLAHVTVLSFTVGMWLLTWLSVPSKTSSAIVVLYVYVGVEVIGYLRWVHFTSKFLSFKDRDAFLQKFR